MIFQCYIPRQCRNSEIADVISVSGGLLPSVLCRWTLQQVCNSLNRKPTTWSSLQTLLWTHSHTHTWSQNKNIHLHTQNQQGGPLLHNRENSQTEDNTLRTRVNIDNAWKEKMSDIQKKQLHFVELKTYFFQLSWLPHYLISTFPVTTISSSSFFYPFVPHLYTDVLQYLCPHLKVPAGLFPPNSPLCILHTKNHWTENVWMFLA